MVDWRCSFGLRSTLVFVGGGGILTVNGGLENLLTSALLGVTGSSGSSAIDGCRIPAILAGEDDGGRNGNIKLSRDCQGPRSKLLLRPGGRSDMSAIPGRVNGRNCDGGRL